MVRCIVRCVVQRVVRRVVQRLLGHWLRAYCRHRRKLPATRTQAMLHVPTLMLALLLGFVLLTLQLGGLTRHLRHLRERPELQRWSLGCWAFLGGMVMLAARLVVPLELSILLGNALLCIGMVLYAQALYLMLCSAPAPPWLMQVQPLVWIALVLMLGWPVHQRTAVLSLIYMALLVPSVRVIVQHGWRRERALRTVALLMAVAVAAMGVRALHAWATPADYTDLVQASLGEGLTFLVTFMCLIAAGFGFLLAVFERVAVQMEEMATHDGLTGCWNRVTTDALLAHELVRARRLGSAVTFVLLDLDHFKQINDRHGHGTGDAVLRAFAQTVRDRLRASDVLGRTGGEEFGLVLPATDLAGARWLVDDVRRAVAAMVVPAVQGQPVQVTVSAGLAVADPQAGVSGDRLYGQADQALYEAKRAGRNRIEAFGASVGASAALPLD